MIFTGITCTRRGSIIFQVFITLAQEAGLDFDKVFDDGEHLIDESLEWDLLRENEKSEMYHVLYKKMEGDKLRISPFFREFGFMKSKCRD